MWTVVSHPQDESLQKLCAFLRKRSDDLHDCLDWPAEQLRACAEAGVYEWFLPRHWGGQEWSAGDICRGYLALSRACLTTTFIITQFMGACQRIARSDRPWVSEEWLGALRTGESFATVGISHLTTSRRHLGQPTLTAETTRGGYVLRGYTPWVTGAVHADLIVTGAVLEGGQQILCAVPTKTVGICLPPPLPLIALSASCTGPVEFQNVYIPDRWVLAGPMPNVMNSSVGGNTGGVQTSTLALGLARAALDFLEQEARCRADLQPVAAALVGQWQALADELIRVAEGNGNKTVEELRSEANGLVLRATQAALTAAKGSGFVEGHPVGRWCREALFFLVWSCPQIVAQTHLCQWAGLA